MKDPLKGCLLLCVWLLLGFSVASAATQEPTLVVENGRVITGDGTVHDRGSVLISGERILDVSDESIEAPNATRIDAAGRTVLPGLIDTHVHLLVPSTVSVPRSDSTIDTFVETGLPARLRDYLEAGITTVMSTGDFWPKIREVRDRVRSGDLPGPRIVTSGPVFTAPGGHPAVTICGPRGHSEPNRWCRERMTVEVESRQQAREAVARLAREGVDLIKMVYDSVSPPGVEQLAPEFVDELIGVAHDHGLRVYAHTYEIRNAITAIEFGVDGLVHTPAFTGEAGERADLAEVMQAAGVAASTTAVVSATLRDRFIRTGNAGSALYLDSVLDGQMKTVAALARADDNLLSLGTDMPGIPGDEAYRMEMFLAEEAGLAPEQMLPAATRNAAIHLGREDDLGTIEPGKLADLIIVGGNPLEDYTALWDVELVVKGGEVVVSRE